MLRVVDTGLAYDDIDISKTKLYNTSTTSSKDTYRDRLSRDNDNFNHFLNIIIKKLNIFKRYRLVSSSRELDMAGVDAILKRWFKKNILIDYKTQKGLFKYSTLNLYMRELDKEINNKTPKNIIIFDKIYLGSELHFDHTRFVYLSSDIFWNIVSNPEVLEFKKEFDSLFNAHITPKAILKYKNLKMVYEWFRDRYHGRVIYIWDMNMAIKFLDFRYTRMDQRLIESVKFEIKF